MPLSDLSFLQLFHLISKCAVLLKVKSAIEHAQRSLPMDGNEALAIATLLQFADILQFNLNTAIKEDADWSTRFMPLTEVVN